MPALDGLRGVAVLAVIAFHLAIYAPNSDGALQGMVAGVVRFGWTGVDLFFVLSGFLITGILYDSLGRGRYFRTFFGRRALRILPLHLSTLAALTACYMLVGGPPAVAMISALPWHAGFLTNVLVVWSESWHAAAHGTSHLWSLAVEEQFYLIWPFVVALAGRFAHPRRRLMILCAALVVVAIALRAFLYSDNVFAAYVLFPARMDALGLGGFVALWVRGPRGATAVVGATRAAGLAALAALIPAAFVSVGSHSYFHPLQQTVGYTLWAVVFGALVVHAAREKGPWHRMLASKPLRAIGRLSFGLYVLHLPIIVALDGAGLTEAGFVPFAATALAVTFGLAAASWRWLERPALELKRHLNYDYPDTGRMGATVGESRLGNSMDAGLIPDGVANHHGNEPVPVAIYSSAYTSPLTASDASSVAQYSRGGSGPARRA